MLHLQNKNKISENILLIGHRKNLLKALNIMGINYTLWVEKKGRTPLANQVTVEFPGEEEKIQELCQKFFLNLNFTHVIACTEKAVYPASVARRFLNCRFSPKSKLLECHDKLLMKKFLEPLKIPMTKFLDPRLNIDTNKIFRALGKPVVVKDRTSSGGRGIKFVSSEQELKKELSETRIYEKFLDAPEGSIESFINNGKILFQSVTQYWEKGKVNLIPSHYSEEIINEIKKLNQKILDSLTIEWGITHLEFYLTPDGIKFGEVAVRPPGGYIVDLIGKSYGFNSWEAIISMELDKNFNFPKNKAKKYTAVQIVHPGEGIITKIEGLELLDSLASIKEVHLNLKIGRKIKKRIGIGQEIGHIFFESSSKEDLVSDLMNLKENFKIVVS